MKETYKALIEANAKIEHLTRELAEHRKAVGQFLTDMTSTMIDPLAEGQSNVAETCAALLTEAQAQRQREYDLNVKIVKLYEVLPIIRHDEDGSVWMHVKNGALNLTLLGHAAEQHLSTPSIVAKAFIEWAGLVEILHGEKDRGEVSSE